MSAPAFMESKTETIVFGAIILLSVGLLITSQIPHSKTPTIEEIRINGIDKRLDGIETRAEAREATTERLLERRLDRIDRKLERLDEKLNELAIAVARNEGLRNCSR
ncbi:hypothetical protein [Cupriavidus necator]